MSALLGLPQFKQGWLCALATGTLLLLLPTELRAYDLWTHEQIVADAIDYMLHPVVGVTPVNDPTAKSDRELLQTLLAHHVTDSSVAEKEILRSTKELKEASRDTDLMQDIWLDLCFVWCTPTAVKYGFSFTTFSHFLNVVSDPLFWNYSGYFYGWVSQNDKCSEVGSFEDKIANLFMEHAHAKFVVTKSYAISKYMNPLKSGTTRQDYEKYFEGQEIQHIQFWPITNLAGHWYDSFLTNTSRKDDKLPLRLAHLGPVLHAAADTTVPYHAVGLSGCGHVEYEFAVEGRYQQNQLYRKDRVRQWLTSPHLNPNLTLEQILIGNAEKAASKCDNKVRSSHCPATIIRDKAVAEDLVNLAIASTVVVIRKAFSEWILKEEQQPAPMVARSDIASPNAPSTIRVFSSWLEVPVDQPAVRASNAVRGVEVQQALYQNFGGMKLAVDHVQAGKISKEVFQQRFNAAINDSTQVVTENPGVEWNAWPVSAGTAKYTEMPPVIQPSIEFRPPTPDEIDDDARWAGYLEERRLFHQAELVFEAGKTLAALKVQEKKVPDMTEKRRIQEAVGDYQAMIFSELLQGQSKMP